VFSANVATDAYLDVLEQWLERTGARVLFAANDATIALLRRHRARLAARVRLALADEPALAIAINKERTLAIARRIGLHVPREVVVRDVGETAAALDEIGLPAVIKPSESWLWNGREGTRLGAQLAVTPATLNFGNVVVNASSALTGSLTATGASVTVTSGTSDSGEFVLSGITFPKTIAAGQSASFTVTFTPTSSGTASGNLTFISNASNSPTIEALTGNGQAPKPHSVDLTWNASSTPGVVGYNIYRGTASGGPYTKVNGIVNSDTSYTDSTVSAGQTYYYVAKSVDGSGVESGPSNEVKVVIPTP